MKTVDITIRFESILDDSELYDDVLKVLMYGDLSKYCNHIIDTEDMEDSDD